jgi:hypothetical protein
VFTDGFNFKFTHVRRKKTEKELDFEKNVSQSVTTSPKRRGGEEGKTGL